MIILLIWYILWESSLVLQDAIRHYRKVGLLFWRILSFGGGLCWDLLPDEKEEVPPRWQDPKHVFVRCLLSTYPVWGSHTTPPETPHHGVYRNTMVYYCLSALVLLPGAFIVIVSTLQLVVNATAHVEACVSRFCSTYLLDSLQRIWFNQIQWWKSDIFISHFCNKALKKTVSTTISESGLSSFVCLMKLICYSLEELCAPDVQLRNIPDKRFNILLRLLIINSIEFIA